MDEHAALKAGPCVALEFTVPEYGAYPVTWTKPHHFSICRCHAQKTTVDYVVATTSCRTIILHLGSGYRSLIAHLGHTPAQAIVDDVLSNGVLACVHRLSSLDRLHSKIPPSLRLVVTAEHTPEDLQTAADAVVAAAKRVLKL